MNTSPNRLRHLFLITAALLAVAWNLKGSFDVGTVPYMGFFTDGTRAINRIAPDSPAAVAGLQLGDVLRTIDSLDVNDQAAMRNLTSLRAGVARHYGFEREGKMIVVDVTADPLPGTTRLTARFTAVAGLVFLACGLLTYTRNPRSITFVFALLGIAACFVFAFTPRGNSQLVRLVFVWCAQLLSVLSAALLLHFTLLFPSRHRLAEQRWVWAALYLPAAGVAVMALLALGVPGLSNTAGSIGGIIAAWGMRILVLLALTTLVTRFVRSDTAERHASGLSILLGGMLIALLPFLILTTLQLVVPTLNIPGMALAQLTLVILPLAFTTALRRQTNRPTPSPTPL